MIKQVIVMRKDLNMRKGKMIAQGAHASMKVFFDRIEYLDTSMKVNGITPQMLEWINGIFTKVVVSVKSEEELLDIQKQANEKGLPNALIKDVGKTEFNGIPTYTCLAIGPDEAEEIDKITGELKLL